jgi:hypothetical protein
MGESKLTHPEVDQYNNKNVTYDHFRKLVNRFTSPISAIMFALRAVIIVKPYFDDQTKSIGNNCIALAQSWIADSSSVHISQLYDAGTDAMLAYNDYVEANDNPPEIPDTFLALNAARSCVFSIYFSEQQYSHQEASLNNSAYSADQACGIDKTNISKLTSYAQHLITKEKDHQFNIPTNQAYQALKVIINKPFNAITEEDIDGLYVMMDDFDIDPAEFNWDKKDTNSVYNDITAKYALYVAIKREFKQQ